jgi:hypothetical protein
VNDLHTLQYGKGYWINATQPITWALKGAPTTLTRQAQDDFTPPATYYGHLLAGSGFTPTVGTEIVASIEGRICARTTTRLFNGRLVYALDVGYTPAIGMCGAPGEFVTFTVDGQDMAFAPWQNDFPQEVTITTGAGFSYLYLPIAIKQGK